MVSWWATRFGPTLVSLAPIKKRLRQSGVHGDSPSETVVHHPVARVADSTTAGTDPKALRIRIADHAVETIASLKNLRRVDDQYESAQINVASDGSALFTRDVGTQEVYAITVSWP